METSRLARATRSGLNWNFLSFGFKQVFDFGVSVALARMLTPKDYGVVALAYIIMQISHVVGHLGMGRALVQKKDLKEVDKNVSFLISILVGAFLGVLFYLLAPWISKFFNSPELTAVIRVLCLQIVLSGTSATAIGLLQRKMNFRVLSLVEAMRSAIVGTIAILMAWFGFGVWSLVWPTVVAAGIQTLLLNRLAHVVPKLQFNYRSFRHLFDFGGLVTIKNLLVFSGRNADYLVIGKWLGDTPLGLYTKAFSLVSNPQRGLISVLSTVFFPAFSRIQDDKSQIREWYLKATQVLAFVVIPAYVGLSAVATNFTIAVFSEKWIGMIRVLQILSIAGAINAIKSLSGSVLEATGNIKIELWTHAARSIVIFLGSVVVIRSGGIEAVAWVVLLAHTADFVFKGRILEKSVGIEFRSLLATLRWPFVSSLVMAGVVSTIQRLGFSPLGLLMMSVPAGVLSYGLFIYVFARNEYGFILKTTADQLSVLRSRNHG